MGNYGRCLYDLDTQVYAPNMRPHHLLLVPALAALACNHNTIGPDDGGSLDASNTQDGAPKPDGSAPDGSAPDGSTPDGGDGGNVKAQQGYTAGSRLKVKYYEGNDGSEEALNFYDSVMNTDCYFSKAADGVTRCIPSGQAVGGMGYVGTGAFSDSNCTVPLGYAQIGCTPTYINQTDNTVTQTCTSPGYPVHVYNAGSQFTGTTIYTKASSTSACTSQLASTYTSIGYNLYSVGSEIAASSLVSATTTVK